VRVKDGFIEFHTIVGAHGEVQYAELNSAKLAHMASSYAYRGLSISHSLVP
jgi:hypothetical protein